MFLKCEIKYLWRYEGSFRASKRLLTVVHSQSVYKNKEPDVAQVCRRHKIIRSIMGASIR